jgi:protein-S-isoprenylcysteine O-methyltransferase Ste14
MASIHFPTPAYEAGVALTAIMFVPLNMRVRAEERLLRAEYEAYFAKTWRLISGVY